MCFGSERDTSPARLGHRFTRFWAQNQTKRSKEKETKETQMAARLRGEEEEEQESMQAAEVQEGGRSGALAAGAAAAPAGSSKASFGPSSSMRGCPRSRRVCRSSHPSRVVRLASPRRGSAETASSRPRNVPA